MPEHNDDEIERRLGSLLPEVCQGNGPAWTAFLTVLHRWLERKLPVIWKRLDEEGRASVEFALIDKLFANQFRVLRRHLGRSGPKWLLGLLWKIARNAACDYSKRQRKETQFAVTKASAEARDSRGPGARPPQTSIITLDRRLKALTRNQMVAYELRRTGHSFAQIAAVMGLSSDKEAQRLVHAAEAQLSRKKQAEDLGQGGEP